MVILIYLFVVLGIGLVAIGIASSTGLASNVRTRLPPDAAPSHRTSPYSFLGYIIPFSQQLLEAVKLDVKIKNKPDAAHVRLMPNEFFNIKIILMAILAAASYFVFNRYEPLVVIGGIALGYLIPDFWLANKIMQRKQKIKHFLPETVDLLGLCVEAGLDFTSALRWIIEKRTFNNPMIEELTYVLEEIKWGKSRSQALKDMSKRLNIGEVSSFVRLLIQAERMGTPVAEAFGVISEDTRLQRYRAGERYAMKAPIKILIPLIFCILPVIGIIVGGPIMLRFMEGGLFK